MIDVAVKAPAEIAEDAFVQKLRGTEVVGRNQMKIRKMCKCENFFRRHGLGPTILSQYDAFINCCGFSRIISGILHRSLQKLISNIYYHTVIFNDPMLFNT